MKKPHVIHLLALWAVMIPFAVKSQNTSPALHPIDSATQKVLDSLAEAALKAMADSPRWEPAVQNGKYVKSYKKQPITFKLTPA